MAPVIELSSDRLIVRRAELLESVGLSTNDEFLERANLGLLSDSEWAIRDELDGISFLLGDDTSD